jgi:hypothetical protein
MSRWFALLALFPIALPPAPPLTIDWKDNLLTIRGDQIPGGKVEVWYLEAYCRPNSTDADWDKHTVIGHETELVRRNDDGTRLELRDALKDGVTVSHVITAGADQIDFQITAHNPTDKASEAHWAQPCVRVGEFTSLGDPADKGSQAYIERCWIFQDGKLAMMPTPDWATKARYVPGQVWAAPGVPRSDVNPRPLNPHVPTSGLIGCFSADGKQTLAIAFDPYQELFQGVIQCIHSDFRLGGLKSGETKHVHGKLYLTDNDIAALVKRYRNDFPKAP